MQQLHKRFGRRAPLLSLIAALGVASGGLAHAGDTLYERIGGEAKLRAAVNEFTLIIQADDRINFTFADTDLTKFKQLLFEQLCALSEGPCKYSGRDMRAAHAKLNITNAQFNALAEDLYTALDRVRVPYRLQNKLMALLAPMQRDIVKPGFIPENGPAPTNVR
jgi:hemoglobin